PSTAPHHATSHDQPRPKATSDQSVARGPWPARTESVRRHNGMVELRGTFTDADLVQLQRAVPARVITLDQDRILIWPPGTSAIEHHNRGLVFLHGYFEAGDLAAIRALHPEQTVSHAGDQITIWPTTLTRARLEKGDQR
ncbi:hypothetical protein G6045_08715, partial [Streptomyces sp. YC504]